MLLKTKEHTLKVMWDTCNLNNVEKDLKKHKFNKV